MAVADRRNAAQGREAQGLLIKVRALVRPPHPDLLSIGMIIQACLNGARRTDFHPRLPPAVEAIARDGASCLAAGATELHIHPRGSMVGRSPTGPAMITKSLLEPIRFLGALQPKPEQPHDLCRTACEPPRRLPDLQRFDDIHHPPPLPVSGGKRWN